MITEDVCNRSAGIRRLMPTFACVLATQRQKGKSRKVDRMVDWLRSIFLVFGFWSAASGSTAAADPLRMVESPQNSSGDRPTEDFHLATSYPRNPRKP